MIRYVVTAIEEAALMQAVNPADLVAHVVSESVRKVLEGRPVTVAALDSLRVEVVRRGSDKPDAMRRRPSPLHEVRVTVNA